MDGFKYGRTPGGGFKLLAGFQDWAVASTAHEGQETMQPTARSLSMFVLLMSLLGATALFLPFTSGISPWYVVSEVSRSIVETRDIPPDATLILLAAPFFLAVPVVVWEVRRLVADRVGTGEMVTAYGLAMTAMLSVLVLSMDDFAENTNTEALISTSLCIALAATNFVLLARNRRGGLSREAIVEAFLLGGYLPNAIFNLVVWFPWDIGAYLIAVACVGYVAAIVMLSRGKPAGTPNPLGASGS